MKILRVGVALGFFTLTALVFLDFHNRIAPSDAAGVLYLQFGPSLRHYIHTAAAGATGFIVVIILTLLFGRVYCSTICPLGTLQDVISFAVGRGRKRRKFHFSAPHNALRYSILSLTVVLLLAGSGLLFSLLDPFSSFGRIVANLLRPIALLVNNGVAVILEQWGVYALARLQWATFAAVSAGVSMVTLLVVVWLAATRGRLYCNIFCPVGTLLGLLARVSCLRIGIDQDACKGCRSCEDVCKAGCIDSRQKRVDSSRCVSCFNCLTVCQKNGLRFENRWRRPVPAAQPDPKRREFLVNSGIFFLGITGVGEPAKEIIQSKPTTIPERVTCPVSPPGSGTIAHFTATCTACHLCVSACPSRVLVPSLFEFGLEGVMQPRLNFHSGYCNYDCTICMNLCPSGAILPLSVEQKKRTQLGVARFIKENCVVFTDNTACGACSEHCPTKAVDMVPYPNPTNKPLKIPEMKPDYCIGCGGCEHACPTKPYKAICVDGNPAHKFAKKPVVEKIETKVEVGEDFPF